MCPVRVLTRHNRNYPFLNHGRVFSGCDAFLTVVVADREVGLVSTSYRCARQVSYFSMPSGGVCSNMCYSIRSGTHQQKVHDVLLVLLVLPGSSRQF